MTVTDRLAVLFVKLVGRAEDAFAAFVVWLRSEPVATRLLAAAAATWLAKQGIDLDPLVVGPIAVAVAGWAARRKVSPSA